MLPLSTCLNEVRKFLDCLALRSLGAVLSGFCLDVPVTDEVTLIVGPYAITGYRLPWFGVLPFVGTQHLNVGKHSAFTCWELNGGLNVRLTDHIVLKAVGLWVWRPDPVASSKSEGQFLTQIAWSF